MTFIDPYRHHADCEFWCDQYHFECSCGLTAPRPEWATLEEREPVTKPMSTEADRLRKGIQDYLAGDYPNPRDHRPGKCTHGIYYWEACEGCIDGYFTKLLAGDNQ